MYSFKNDYAEGAHPAILEALMQSNMQQQPGYGLDCFSEKAGRQIKLQLNNPHAQIYFVSGGTQTNLLVISHLLKPYQAVISPDTGHIYTNEAGAIEATGHKVIACPSVHGKIDVDALEQTLKGYSLKPHVVQPAMVYISNSTELGTLYSQQELQELHQFCKDNELLLFVDGARLGHAICSAYNNLSFTDMGKYCDVFYIGGTKNGALLGEAIVFNDPKLAIGFDFSLKQKGALLAKGRLLGIQFLTLFETGLYWDLARHANEMAQRLATALSERGFEFLEQPLTNQIFPVLPNTLIEKLSQHADFYVWKQVDEHRSAIRLITSWATPIQEVEKFLAYIE